MQSPSSSAQAGTKTLGELPQLSTTPAEQLTVGVGAVDVPEIAMSTERVPTRSDRSLLNEVERLSNPGAYISVDGAGVVARSGDNISRMLGTSDPQAIGNFMRANGMSSSNIEVGRNYFMPSDTGVYGDASALGQAVLNEDNARLAALARERFNFGDGMDARDIRQSFGYQSRMSVEMAKVDAQAAYLASAANAPSMTAWDGVGRPDPGAVSPLRKGATAALGMVADGLGVLQGVAITATGVTLTGAPDPSTLTKWVGVPLTAYGATFTTKSVVGFGLNATNLITAIRGSTAESGYLPGSALEMAVSLGGGSPEAQRLAVAGDMAWGLATGRVMTASVATGTNPRVASLFQEIPYAYTSAERQAALLAPNAWGIAKSIETPTNYWDLGVKSFENIVEPFTQKKGQK